MDQDIDLNLNNNPLSPLPETPLSEIDAHLPQPESPHLPEIYLNLSLHDDELQNETNHTTPFDLNNSVNHRIMASNEQRQKIFEVLLKKSANGVFIKGESTTNEVANMFGVSSRTVQRIWRQGKGSLSNGSVGVNVNHRKTNNCGRKRIEINIADLQRVELCKQTTVRSLTSAVGICGKTAMHDKLKQGQLRRHSYPVKPYLTNENKLSRLRWCHTMIDWTIPFEPMFDKMLNVVHTDEKWFNLTKKNENYYLHPLEDDPLRTCKSTNFIPNIMFLTAIARPRIDSQGNCLFDGKIGIFSLVTYEAARRSSVNRPAGTLEIKPITSIKKDVIRSFMIEKVLPAIRAKWPKEDRGSPIYIQQDNAPTHIDPNDLLFREAANREGFDTRLISQPPNSPDLNALDLGFFRAIQSIQHTKAPRNSCDLVRVVEESFNEYSPHLSNRIFVTLQSYMAEIMKVRGSNHYKIPHMQKQILERQHQLPLQLKCDLGVIEESSTLL